ncbi:hypothetical protein [Streptomyces sp. LN325]|uniref:hypothetical protein n=1 Tax=Streptomyces sp. LN325 TaxID=3112976 RepID=UPI00371C1351
MAPFTGSHLRCAQPRAEENHARIREAVTIVRCAHNGVVGLGLPRIRQLERKPGALPGDRVRAESGIGTPTDVEELRRRSRPWGSR